MMITIFIIIILSSQLAILIVDVFWDYLVLALWLFPLPAVICSGVLCNSLGSTHIALVRGLNLYNSRNRRYIKIPLLDDTSSMHGPSCNSGHIYPSSQILGRCWNNQTSMCYREFVFFLCFVFSCFRVFVSVCLCFRRFDGRISKTSLFPGIRED